MINIVLLLQNSMLWRSTSFYIVTFVHWNIMFMESCMYKSVLGKINKLQKKTIVLLYVIGDALQSKLFWHCPVAVEYQFSKQNVYFLWNTKMFPLHGGFNT